MTTPISSLVLTKPFILLPSIKTFSFPPKLTKKLKTQHPKNTCKHKNLNSYILSGVFHCCYKGSGTKMGSDVAMITCGASVRAHALFSPRVLKTFLWMVLNFMVVILFFPFRRSPEVVAGGGREKARSKEEKERERERGRGGVVKVPASVPWKSSTAEVAAVDQEVATRRSMAVKRVMHGSNENCVRDFQLMGTNRGQTIFTQSWTPLDNDIRGVVIIMHGLNEHGDRYDRFAKELIPSRLKIYAMDWIGHGGSDGLHGYVHSLDDAVSDMKSFISKVVAENPGMPCFCFGHSTGAAIILKTVLDPKIEACVAGIVLTSPAVGVQQTPPALAALAPIFSFLLPRYQLSPKDEPGVVVCRDPEAIVAKYSDPLVYTAAIRIRTGYEILRITSFLQQNLTRLNVPFLVLHGTADLLTSPKVSQKLYDEASSTDKTIRLIEGLFHDLLFEPERDMIVGDIISWFNSRI